MQKIHKIFPAYLTRQSDGGNMCPENIRPGEYLPREHVPQDYLPRRLSTSRENEPREHAPPEIISLNNEFINLQK